MQIVKLRTAGNAHAGSKAVKKDMGYHGVVKKTRYNGEASVTKTVCIIYGRGCPRTRFATALFHEYFAENGWQLTNDTGEAKIILISTCAFEEFTEEMSIKLLSIVNNRKGNDAQIIAFGCLPGIAKDRLQKYHAIALPPRDYGRLDEFIGASIKLDQIENPHFINDYIIKSSMSLGWVEKLLTKFPIYWKFFDRAIPRFLIAKGPVALSAAYDNLFDIKQLLLGHTPDTLFLSVYQEQDLVSLSYQAIGEVEHVDNTGAGKIHV